MIRPGKQLLRAPVHQLACGLDLRAPVPVSTIEGGAEIGQDEPPLGIQKYIRGVYIAMDNPLAMQRRDRIDYGSKSCRQLDKAAGLQQLGPVIEQAAGVHAAVKSHQKIGGAIDLSPAENPLQRRMPEPGGDLDLAPQLLEGPRLRGGRLPEGLESVSSTRDSFCGLEDRGRVPPVDFSLDVVPAEITTGNDATGSLPIERSIGRTRAIPEPGALPEKLVFVHYYQTFQVDPLTVYFGNTRLSTAANSPRK